VGRRARRHPRRARGHLDDELAKMKAELGQGEAPKQIEGDTPTSSS
jgi:hypothetical protein